MSQSNCFLEIVWSNLSENEREKSESSKKNNGSKKSEKGELKRDVRNGRPGEKVTLSVWTLFGLSLC